MPFTGVVLIIGAGPRIGRSVASWFASNGYKVALVVRNLSKVFSAEGYLNIQADLSDPNSVPSIFHAVGKAFGVPNIIVFNGSCIFLYLSW
jgi:NAD(P)-dependent dehydrogenase (short-subunit alcohol dehydrogenase family)